MNRLGYSEERVAEMTPQRVESIIDAHLALNGKRRPGAGKGTTYVATRRKNKE